LPAKNRRGREAPPVRRRVDRGWRYRADQTALSRLRRAGHGHQM